MAMSSAHQNFVSNTSTETRRLLEFFAKETQLNVLWSGAPAYQTAITQEEIDSVASFAGAGLTAQNIADAQYAMAAINTSIQNALVALTILANLP